LQLTKVRQALAKPHGFELTFCANPFLMRQSNLLQFVARGLDAPTHDPAAEEVLRQAHRKNTLRTEARKLLNIHTLPKAGRPSQTTLRRRTAVDSCVDLFIKESNEGGTRSLEAILRQELGDHYPGAAPTSKSNATDGGAGGGNGVEGTQIKSKCDFIKALALGAICETGELQYCSLIARDNVG